MTQSRRVDLLSTDHLDGLRVLSTEYDVAAVLGVAGPLSATEAAEYIETTIKARDEGRSYVFVLTDGTDVLGICRLIGVKGVPRLIVAVGGAYRGRGNGLRLVKHVLEYAFETLGLDRVTASGPCLSLVSQCRVESNGQLLGGITREEWSEARAQSAGES